MEKIYIFRIDTEDGMGNIFVVFKHKPSREDIISYLPEVDDLEWHIEEILTNEGSTVFPCGDAVSLEEHIIVDNSPKQSETLKDNGEGVGVVVAYSRDVQTVLNKEEFENFFDKLSEYCEVLWQDEETGRKFNYVEPQSFLDFYAREKENGFEEFDEREIAMIERINALIVEDKPSYIQDGWVKLI